MNNLDAGVKKKNMFLPFMSISHLWPDTNHDLPMLGMKQYMFCNLGAILDLHSDLKFYQESILAW